MHLDIEHKNDVCHVNIDGELTIYNAAEFKSAMLEPLEACSKMEVNLAKVHELDAAGLQCLALLKREAASLERTLSFVGHSQAVLEVLDLCDLGAAFGDPLVISAAKT